MKVLQLSKYYPPIFGGIEQVAFDITTGMNESGIDVDVDVLSVNNNFKTITEFESNKIIRTAKIFSFLSTPISLSYIKKWKDIRHEYDMIHIHLPNPLAVMALLLFPVSVPIVLHWHSDIVKQKIALKLFKPFQDLLLKKSNKVIVTSEIYGQSSPQLQNFRHKITCIPIGIKSNRLPENKKLYKQLRNKYRDKKIIFSLGRLVYYKGFNVLIKAAQSLPEDFVVIIGGEGELFTELSNVIKRYKLEKKVKLIGSIPYSDLSAYYQVCDLFCLPSIHESEAFGVVQLEAMSYGKPVVSTNIRNSGVPWVNKNKVSGLIVEPNDSAALASAISTILIEPNHYSQGAIQRYNQLFTREKMVADLFHLYTNLNEGN